VIAGLVLAAGGGRRFGGPKQLAELDGRPLVEHGLATLGGAPGLERVVVVLGARADEVLAASDLGDAEPVVCAEWEEGQAASLRTGVAALADADAVVVVLADQPTLSPDAVRRVLDAARAEPSAPAVRATYGGEPGHPVVLRSALFREVARLRGDQGARALIDGIALDVPCDPLPYPPDVDTPEALEALR
jgi:CTP:molybdopterin cytidylyltransferase MocA